jgi:hypothetical protein
LTPILGIVLFKKRNVMSNLKSTATFVATMAAMAVSSAFSAVSAQQVFPIATTTVAPVADAFYKAPATSALASVAPGTVLRYRPIPLTAYSANVSAAYQLMFRTTDGHDAPVAAVTTVLIPKTAPASGRKLLSYQPFYDSLTLNCSPSSLTVSGKMTDKGFVNGALTKGIVVVMTDYEGLQSQWMAALNTAHSVLDGVRAAESFTKSGLSSAAPVALVGYSGGGFATAWANEVATEYAPELNIVGAAMGGLPANPINVAKKVDGGLFSGVYFGAVVGLYRAYPNLDINKYASAKGVTMVQDIGTRCLGGTLEGQPELLTKYAFQKGSTYLKDPNFLNLPEMQAINLENTMGQRVPKAPVYIAEGTADELMPIADVDNLVATYCAAGTPVQYNRVSGGDHITVGLGYSVLINYALDRLNGKAVPTTCP